MAGIISTNALNIFAGSSHPLSVKQRASQFQRLDRAQGCGEQRRVSAGRQPHVGGEAGLPLRTALHLPRPRRRLRHAQRRVAADVTQQPRATRCFWLKFSCIAREYYLHFNLASISKHRYWTVLSRLSIKFCAVVGCANPISKMLDERLKL